jgi:hypothetical protein
MLTSFLVILETDFLTSGPSEVLARLDLVLRSFDDESASSSSSDSSPPDETRRVRFKPRPEASCVTCFQINSSCATRGAAWVEIGRHRRAAAILVKADVEDVTDKTCETYAFLPLGVKTIFPVGSDDAKMPSSSYSRSH